RRRPRTGIDRVCRAGRDRVAPFQPFPRSYRPGVRGARWRMTRRDLTRRVHTRRPPRPWPQAASRHPGRRLDTHDDAAPVGRLDGDVSAGRPIASPTAFGGVSTTPPAIPSPVAAHRPEGPARGRVTTAIGCYTPREVVPASLAPIRRVKSRQV